MESEKKDYISNQETTAVYYKKPNQKMIDRYLQIYEKAKENKNIKACYLGLDKQFRIIRRDSYISIYRRFPADPVKTEKLEIHYISAEKPSSFLCGDFLIGKIPFPYKIMLGFLISS